MSSRRVSPILGVVPFCLAGVILTTAHAARADEGMWLLTKPPTKHLKEKYGFEPDAKWLEHVQKSAVRIGASGSLVSPEGLVMTNHHVGSDALEKLSTPERNLMENGFYAKTREEELKCPDMEVEILWSIEDVTDKINAAAKADLPAAEAFAAKRKMMSTIEAENQKKSGLQSQIVTLYQGGQYHLYQYKRFTDIRLVMAPEQQIAFYGGDNDNFEYPRFDLDMCFFRIYENGKPLKSEHYLKWSKDGSKDGELALVFGHPARTRRLNTVDHLRFLRDVDMPSNLQRLWRREVQLGAFAGRSEENARIANEDIHGVANSRKAATGSLAGLQDPAVFQKKVDAEKALRAAVMSKPDQQAKWGDAWDKIAAAQKSYREFHVRYQAINGRGFAAGSQLVSTARHIVRLADELPKPSAERLREYRESELESLYLGLYSPAPIYDELEIDRIASGLSLMVETLGAEDPLVASTLAGKSPRVRAEALVRGSKLKDIATRKKLVEGGKKAVADSDDPMIRYLAGLDAESRVLRKRFEDEVESVERENYAKIAAAQFAMKGDSIYPDATFSLRMAFGPIKGYKEDGRDIAPFTTFAGLFGRNEERKGKTPFELDKRWLDRKAKLKLDTPFNFVFTGDIIGGNSGSPVVNKAGEVIGLIFDGNIQSLVWDVAYDDQQARAVAVDSRGIIEALRKVYDADALADELVGK